MAELAYHRRDAELLEGSDRRWDQTEDSPVTVSLLQIIAAKPRFLIHLIGKIEVTAFLEKLPIFRSCDFAQHQDRFIAKHRLLPHCHHIAVPTHFRRLPLPNMQIGRSFFHNLLQKLIQICHQRRPKCCRTISFCSARASASSAVIKSRLNNSINVSSINCIPCLRLV